MQLNWADFKSVILSRGVYPQYVVAGLNYWLKLIIGNFEVECLIPTDGSVPDTADFIANFQSLCNPNLSQPVAITIQPPLASNAAGNSKFFYQRIVGIRQALSAGSNTFIWTQNMFPMSQVYAIEIIGAENGDYTDFIVLDTATGTLSGHPNAPLNQFGFTTNVAPIFYLKEAKFPATIPQGLQFQFVYNSVSAKTIGINIIFHEIK